MDDMRRIAILLVEDREEDRCLMRHAFRKARIVNPLIEVRDGEEAIEYLSGVGRFADRKQYPIPFLILLDLRMPKVSGFEVVKWVRGRPEFNELIVVVLTCSDDMRDVNQAHELGADSYLIKPGNPDELTAMMKRIEGSFLMVAKRRAHSTTADGRSHG